MVVIATVAFGVFAFWATLALALARTAARAAAQIKRCLLGEGEFARGG